MRAAPVLLLVAALAAAEAKRELVYRFTDDRVVAVVQARIRHAGLKDVTVAVSGRDRFVIRCAPGEVERVKKLAVDPGKVSFRITVERDEPGHEFYFKLFRSRVAKGVDEAKACRIERANLSDADREKSPLGLEWHRLGGPPDEVLAGRGRSDENGVPWMLVRRDGYDVDGEALTGVVAHRDVNHVGGGWTVFFKVKKKYQRNVAELTAFEEDKYMAILLNGKVHSAPQLRSTLTDSGQITGAFTEEEAKRLAAVLNAGSLPHVPELVAER